LATDKISQLFSAFDLAAETKSIDDGAMQQDLSAGALMLLFLSFPEGEHFAILSGYDAVRKQYSVQDPRYGPFPAPYIYVQTAYNLGSLSLCWSISAP
jgi:hypothetical protein